MARRSDDGACDGSSRAAESSIVSGTIQRVGVVGCGLMGSGIAEVCARAGLDVMVREVDTESLERGRARLATSVARAVRRQKVSLVEADAALARLSYTTDIGELADCDLVVEAATESEPVKL